MERRKGLPIRARRRSVEERTEGVRMTIDRIPRLARATPAQPPARRGAARRAGRLRRRDVLATTSRRGACGRASRGTPGAGSAPRSRPRRFSLGVVTAPGQRYHPAITAQAIATLEEMFPGRFWAALGSGEAINEHVTGDPWPPKEDRDARLDETIDVMRRLLARRGGLASTGASASTARASGACPSRRRRCSPPR